MTLLRTYLQRRRLLRHVKARAAFMLSRGVR